MDELGVANNWDIHRREQSQRHPPATLSSEISKGVFWGILRVIALLAVVAGAVFLYSVTTMEPRERYCFNNPAAC